MSKLVTGLFTSRSAAALAVDRLVDAGFSIDDVSLLMSEHTRGREFAVESHSKAPEGGVTGAVAGGALGAIAAALVATGAVIAPPLGLVAAGPVVAALAGAGAGGAAGGLVGAIIGAGIPEHEANMVAEKIEAGSILVGIHAHDDRVSIARELLQTSGAEQVKTRR